MIQLLILQPGTDQITIVFYLLKHVLQGREPPRYLPMTAQHSPAFGQQLPEPRGHVVRAARHASVRGARLELADKTGKQLTGDGDLADRRGRRLPQASGPVTRPVGERVWWRCLDGSQDGGRLLPGQQAIDLGNLRRQRQVQGPASVRPAKQMRELAWSLLGDRPGEQHTVPPGIDGAGRIDLRQERANRSERHRVRGRERFLKLRRRAGVKYVDSRQPNALAG